MFQLNRWDILECGYHAGVLHGGSDRLADLGPYQWPGTRTHLHHALAGTNHDDDTSTTRLANNAAVEYLSLHRQWLSTIDCRSRD